jgi:hypothetical protein
MPLARECRKRALVLIELAKEATEFKDQLFAISQMWLTLATLEDQINAGVDQDDKLNLLH